MKEATLRGMIRRQIKSSLTEAPGARASVGAKLGAAEKTSAIKMLKRALGQGTPQQQAAGLFQVVQAISGKSAPAGKILARMLMKGGLNAPEAPEAPISPVEEDVSANLTNRMGRLDKTQAMSMLRKTLKNKPASQQAEFVADLVKSLQLKGNISMLIKKIRQVN